MQDTVERLGSWRTQGVYDIGVAHRLTGVSANSIKRWLQAYPAYILDLKPPWKDGMGRPWTNLTRLSFLEFVEVLIAGKIRAGRGVNYSEVREFHDGLAPSGERNSLCPRKSDISQKGLLPQSAVETLGQMDFEDGFASRWLPLGKAGSLALDPRRVGGQPAIKGRRLRVVDISDFFVVESLSRIWPTTLM